MKYPPIGKTEFIDTKVLMRKTTLLKIVVLLKNKLLTNK